jgi:aminocarboxymuconate-semialdehyde decarboxylase
LLPHHVRRISGGEMSKVRTIDTHTHVLTQATAALLRKEAPTVPVTITPIDEASATLDVGGIAYRPYPRGGFDLEHRLRDMDAAGVDVQVLSATPQTYLYNQEAGLGAAIAAIQNDQIAKLVKENPQRFMGIATLPMQAPEKAAGELRRAVTKLGLRGTMIASNIMGKNLDDPSFEPLWATAEDLGAFVFVHPNNVAGADRMKSYYLNNLIGNPLDTTILHSAPVLEFMIGHVGANRVMLGSDYPYDMGMMDCVNHVRSLKISDADKAIILGSRAEALLSGKS